MLDEAKDNIYCGGNVDEVDLFISPTLITGERFWIELCYVE